jgi:hypothetical protein
MKGGRPRPSRRRGDIQAWGHLALGRALESRKPNGDLCDQIYRLAAQDELPGGASG